jgi:hypothetical protein
MGQGSRRRGESGGRPTDVADVPRTVVVVAAITTRVDVIFPIVGDVGWTYLAVEVTVPGRYNERE